MAVLASGYRLDITDNAYQMRVNPTQRISGQRNSGQRISGQ
jgi:hypothetical protein